MNRGRGKPNATGGNRDVESDQRNNWYGLGRRCRFVLATSAGLCRSPGAVDPDHCGEWWSQPAHACCDSKSLAWESELRPGCLTERPDYVRLGECQPKCEVGSSRRKGGDSVRNAWSHENYRAKPASKHRPEQLEPRCFSRWLGAPRMDGAKAWQVDVRDEQHQRWRRHSSSVASLFRCGPVRNPWRGPRDRRKTCSCLLDDGVSACGRGQAKS